ncbi:Gfo/Idh/MocA family oxidoreductase [Paenibacillus sp. LHD-117]|uniref:Gfo/Idh/MocA family protein n=1 Tax=Paenibacillus sp. LHD-117 TaxID=3071412 RepID=UPI0027DEAC8F|nr:Gfo/Idh/MocA family oxidoreductase [Paenibacillus sp. LHD-117]MDQ6419713.1 Gfo/Idh/MocA family oxidoreductase [Paenibacillus sp. LHD-117]
MSMNIGDNAKEQRVLKAGLIGIGFMGRVHLAQYSRLEKEGYPIRLTAVCDIDQRKFHNVFVEGNLNESIENIDFSPYRLYGDIDEMLASEELDFVDIALPTDLHADVSVRALKRGLHVLCEKPMALNATGAHRMLEAAEQAGLTLMIAQCLRFWPVYEYLKACVAEERYGAPLAGTFFRGCSPPVWSHGNWMLNEERSGGILLDLHVHDVDMINWLFGLPDSVSCMGRNVYPGSGFDIVSTHYSYPDGKVILAQSDGTLQGDFGFEMSFRVNFERGNLIFEKGVLTDHPAEGTGFKPELDENLGFYREIRYFAERIAAGEPVERSLPADTLGTIRIAEAERLSAVRGGEWVKIGR